MNFDRNHEKTPRTNRRKLLIALGALCAVLCASVGLTAAFLVSRPAPVENNFTIGKVACKVLEALSEESGTTVKRNVLIENTGNTSAYIRVLLVFTWKDADGNVFVNPPEVEKDFEINLMLSNGWIYQPSDVGAYLYYNQPVAPGAQTPELIDSVQPLPDIVNPEDGTYKLSVEILADAVQSDPADAVEEAWKDVTVGENGVLSVKGGTSYE